MPIYHFTVRQLGKKYEDREGLAFDNLDGAWEEATTAADQMIKDLDGELIPGTLCSVEVQDEFHDTIRTVNISVAGPRR